MNTPRVPPRFVPTLTEVVEFEEAQLLDEPIVVPVEPIALEPAFTPTLAPALVPVPAPPDLSLADEVSLEQLDAQPVPDAQVVAHVAYPETVVTTSSTEDVPAFLLATQPVPMWSPPAAVAPAEPAVAEHEPVLSAIVSKPVVATERIDEPIAEPAADAVAIPVAVASMLGAEREEQIVQSVLTELQRRSDLMLEYRLRETLTPILARLCDTLIKEAREDLAVTLRDVVSRAVSQELARHRPK